MESGKKDFREPSSLDLVGPPASPPARTDVDISDSVRSPFIWMRPGGLTLLEIPLLWTHNL